MQIRITVPEEVVELAARAGLGTEDYVERLLGSFAASQPALEATRSRLRDELLADWNQYQQDNLHITGDEVDAWLERLTLDPSADAPALHK